MTKGKKNLLQIFMDLEIIPVISTKLLKYGHFC